MKNLEEFIKENSLNTKTVRSYISRNQKKFNNHIKKEKNGIQIDLIAEKLLKEKYKAPTELITSGEPERYIEALEEIRMLQKKLLEAQKIIFEAEATKLLLEDRQMELEKTRQENKNLEEENKKLKENLEKEKNKSIIKRLFK